MTRSDLIAVSASVALTALPVPVPLAPHESRAEREQLLADLHARMHGCTHCVAAGYLARNTSVAGFRGRIGDRVMVVGQAPGHLSVERGRPFMGPGGRLLDGWLQRAGFPPGALWDSVYVSAITKCDPGRNPRGGGDRKPTPAEQALCRPYLLAELDLVRPEVILPVGGMAIDAFLGPSKLDTVIGQAYERNNVRILPLPHPSGVSRWLNTPRHQALLAQALAILADWRRDWGRGEE
jgi:uracil-DNA glycosylase family 4